MYMASLPMSVIIRLSATFWTARPSTLTGPMLARAAVPSAQVAPGDSSAAEGGRGPAFAALEPLHEHTEETWC
jgi:hypothetical protein